jgi:hypothetical protein
MSCFAGLVSWKIWALMLDSYESGIRSSTYLLTPQWIPEGILGMGYSLLTIASAAMAVSLVLERLSGGAGTSPGAPADPSERPQIPGHGSSMLG